VYGFACHRVSEFPEYQTDPVVYSGPQVMDKFYEHIMKESQVISDLPSLTHLAWTHAFSMSLTLSLCTVEILRIFLLNEKQYF